MPSIPIVWSFWKTFAAFVLPFYIFGNWITLYYAEPTGDLPGRVVVMGQINGLEFTDSARAICNRREMTGLFNPSMFCIRSTEDWVLSQATSLPAIAWPPFVKIVATSANWDVPTRY